MKNLPLQEYMYLYVYNFLDNNIHLTPKKFHHNRSILAIQHASILLYQFAPKKLKATHWFFCLSDFYSNKAIKYDYSFYKRDLKYTTKKKKEKLQ